jgi:beta-glucosidase
VQVYATDRVASIVRPVRELKAFAKVSIDAGETSTVSIPLPVDALALVAPDERTVLESGEFEIQAGHDSRSGSLLAAVITVL